MLKTCLMSFCKTCVKNVNLFEETVDKFTKDYYCRECGKYVRRRKLDKEKE